jgi:hypothetical protein
VRERQLDQVGLEVTCRATILERYEEEGTFLSTEDIRDVRKLYGGHTERIHYRMAMVLRSQNQRYLKLSNAGVVSLTNSFALLRGSPPAGEYPVRHRVFAFEPAGNTPPDKPSAQYIDTVRLDSVNEARYICSVEVGGQAQLVSFARDAPEVAANCTWSIQRSATDVGGANVEVNDPFRLRRSPQFASGPYYMKLENETHWRALGPFALDM